MLNAHGFISSAADGASLLAPEMTGDRSMPSTAGGIGTPANPSRVGITSMTLSGNLKWLPAGTRGGKLRMNGTLIDSSHGHCFL